jgi:two-component system response regulator EvgA
VDDHVAIRKTLRDIFERHLSVVCHEAVNGLDAIQQARVYVPDLIILDFAMPQMDGFQAAMVLQRMMPHVPLFMLTSYPCEEIEPKATSVGIRAVFSKAKNMDPLLSQARAVLNKRVLKLAQGAG